MEQRRFILFIALSMLVLMGWMNIGPKVFPGLFPKPRQRQVKPVAEADHGQDGIEAAVEDAKPPEDGKQPEPANADRVEVADNGGEKASADDKSPDRVHEPQLAEPPNKGVDKHVDLAKLPKHEHQEIQLGSIDPESGYFMRVALTSLGAAIGDVELSDPRYKELTDRKLPLRVLTVVEDEENKTLRTFQTSVEQVDEQLRRFGTSLNELDWEVETTVPDEQVPGAHSKVVFRMVSPDGKIEVRKGYELKKVDQQGAELVEARDTDPSGYQLHCKLTLKNLTEEKESLSYTLQGPVGVPLENAANTRIFRAVKMGFLERETGEVTAKSMTASAIAKAADKDTLPEWRKPLKYIGVDVLYFAALLLPQNGQTPNDGLGYFDFVEFAKPMRIDRQAEASHSQVSLQLKSVELTLEPGKETTHAYRLYIGPKRQALLAATGDADTVDADGILQYGWFGPVAKVMLALLKFLHGLGIPYGIAIICMTVMVRGCMFPVSRKQAAGAKKMKELQPKIQELKKKYGKDKEKMAKAQMELFQKHKYNPLSGCLPIFLQLPIFIGLYTALRNAVDLRMARFLWVDNLAAPDALFPLPFQIPFLGWTEFNLLPVITIGLFVAQQKMFTPPPTDDQQAMQYKMMNFMMVFMGFLFYKVPAGLCVYFIASSLWGMGERKMLDLGKSKPAGPDGASPPPPQKSEKKTNATTSGGRSTNGAPKKPKPPGKSPGRKGKKKSRSRR